MSKAATRPRQRHLDLAQRILQLAQESRMAPGDRLPEQLLASRCNVSRTPIRKAFQILAEKGLVAFEEGEGYRLSADPSGLDAGQDTLPTGREDELHAAILRDLAARRIGEAQTVAALQRRYKASRPTVQNALQRLAEDRLVERAAGQRWLLKSPALTPEALAQSYDFRMVLEPAALLAPGFRAEAVLLAAQRQAMEGLLASEARQFDIARFERTDCEFHELIARSCANPFMAEALLAEHRRRRSLPGGGGVNVFRLMQSTREHLQILEQIERGQMELAADLMRVHLRMSRPQRPRLAVGRGVPLPLRTAEG
jgi:DNA-binding GntR family transcriptional regulator